MSKSKYPCVYKDKKGTIYYHVELGVDKITGDRIQKRGRTDDNHRKFRTLKECNDYVIALKNRYAESKGIYEDSLEFNRFIDERYLAYYKLKVQGSTFRSRKRVFDLIKEYFKGFKLEDITTRDCESFKVYLLETKKYAQSYSSLIFGCFKKILDYAAYLDYTHNNVSLKAESIPKGDIKSEFWTLEEFQKVISTFYLGNIDQHMYFVMLWLYFNTGIRVGEGQALTWDKVNFKDKTLTINSTMDLESTRPDKVKNRTKTKSGNRIISLDDDTVNILKEWKDVQALNGCDNYIMSYTDQPVGRNTIARVIDRHSKLAGVKKIPAKGLRHSNASYLINYFNADILLVSKRLGHSGPEVTYRHYAHLWPLKDQTLAEMMSNVIEINTANHSLYKFNGNQVIKFDEE